MSVIKIESDFMWAKEMMSAVWESRMNWCVIMMIAQSDLNASNRFTHQLINLSLIRHYSNITVLRSAWKVSDTWWCDSHATDDESHVSIARAVMSLSWWKLLMTAQFPLTEVIWCVIHLMCHVMTVIIMSEVSSNAVSEEIHLVWFRCQILRRDCPVWILWRIRLHIETGLSYLIIILVCHVFNILMWKTLCILYVSKR